MLKFYNISFEKYATLKYFDLPTLIISIKVGNF